MEKLYVGYQIFRDNCDEKLKCDAGVLKVK